MLKTIFLKLLKIGICGKIKILYKLLMAVVGLEKLHFSEELMQYISSMDRENSVCQFFIPGKGRFTLVLQEEDPQSISADVETNPELKQMIMESREQYENGLGMSTSELLKSLSLKDFG